MHDEAIPPMISDQLINHPATLFLQKRQSIAMTSDFCLGKQPEES
jgi:hypothetical protein